jgi:SAM-dependent methyltransferase
MNSAALTPRLRHQLAIIGDAGYKLTTGMCILDFGCGEGDAVAALRAAGYEASGCDVEIRQTPGTKVLTDQGILREIATDTYRLPFENEKFDIVLSNEVFEHVQNYPEALLELHRVMKPGAVSLHLFPARWIPIEPHVNVPFATVIRSLPWLWIWARLGVRNPHQAGFGAWETARQNRQYLINKTNYLSAGEIACQFRQFFPKFGFAEDLFLKHSARGEFVYRYMRHLPGLLRLYRGCWNRVVLAGK